MAPYACIITARTQWHGVAEEFDFVFHYDTGPSPSTQGWIDLLTSIKNTLKPLYRADTTFVRGRVHGPTNGTEEEDQMRAAVDFAAGDNGTNTTDSPLAPELAVILEWDLGRSPAGYRRILKKFLRGCAFPGSSTDMMAGRTALTSTQKNPFIAAGNALKLITLGAVTNNICNAAGVNFPGNSVPQVANFVHSRQMKRGRKRKVSP